MSYPEVHYISNTRVHTRSNSGGDNSTQLSRIQLTPWDLYFLPINYNQKGILYNKPQHLSNYLDILKTSLSRTLDYFYPLAGRLSIKTHHDHTNSVFIDCNNAGVDIIHASVDLTVADIVNNTYVPHVFHSFFALNGATNFQGQTHPLFAVQVTELTDGVFIGFTANHVIVDGSSFWHFINTWSEICKNPDFIPSPPPILTRCFINGCDSPIRLPLFDPEKVNKKYTPKLHLDQRVFHFESRNIARLKAKANEECGMTRISSLQALLSHVWRAVTHARNLGLDQKTRYRLLMSNRARLDPPLPEGYFGNAISYGGTTAKVGELLEGGIGWGALLLNKMVASHNDAVIRDAWDSWVQQPTWPSLDCYVSDDLLSGSSPRFNVYGTDFGWGCPIAARSGCANKSEGKITVFPGKVEGSVDIEACFEIQTLKDMGNDKEFMEAVTVLHPILSFQSKCVQLFEPAHECCNQVCKSG